MKIGSSSSFPPPPPPLTKCFLCYSLHFSPPPSFFFYPPPSSLGLSYVLLSLAPTLYLDLYSGIREMGLIGGRAHQSKFSPLPFPIRSTLPYLGRGRGQSRGPTIGIGLSGGERREPDLISNSPPPPLIVHKMSGARRDLETKINGKKHAH